MTNLGGLGNNLSYIRSQLSAASNLSAKADGSYRLVESSSSQAGSILKDISQDIFQAGISDKRGALREAAQRTEQKLDLVKGHHDQLTASFDTILDIDPAIGKALQNAKAAAERLGLATNDTWLLRNSIGSAQTQAGYAFSASNEIDRKLWGVDRELLGTIDKAGDMSSGSGWGRGGGYGGGYGGHHRGGYGGHDGGSRRHHHGSGGYGNWGAQRSRFRERLEARIKEQRERGRAMDEAVTKLGNPFSDIHRAAVRGSSYQRALVGSISEALRWADDLEKKFSSGRPPVPKRPSPTNPPLKPPANEAPPPTRPAPPASPPPPASPEAPKDPDDFFKGPWRGRS